MTTIEGTHEFSLYRSGWADAKVPWPDNQLWASIAHAQIIPGAGEMHFTLYPRYGSAATHYQLRLSMQESPEVGWASARVSLSIDGSNMSEVALPLSWYVDKPADWPSGLVRFREPDGFRFSPSWAEPGARGVWTLAARRAS